MSRRAARYPEKRLQTQATRWLRTHWGYVETFDDSEAVGADFDSIGSMDERLVLIEVKPRVVANMAWHDPDRAGSLERKIVGGLRQILRNPADVQSVAAHAVWDGRSRPVIAIVAGSYSELGREETEAMLLARGRDFGFDWRLLRWTGSAIEEIAGWRGDAEPATDYASLVFPALTSRYRRSPPTTLDEWLDRAASAGIGDLVEHFLVAAATRGLRLVRQAGSLRLLRPHPDAPGKWQAFLSVFPLAQDGVSGLDFSVWREGADLEEGDMPGRPTASINGFFNTNRFVCETGEIDAMLNLFAVPTRTP